MIEILTKICVKIIQQNETADGLAREEANTRPIGLEPFYHNPCSVGYTSKIKILFFLSLSLSPTPLATHKNIYYFSLFSTLNLELAVCDSSILGESQTSR